MPPPKRAKNEHTPRHTRARADFNLTLRSSLPALAAAARRPPLPARTHARNASRRRPATAPPTAGRARSEWAGGGEPHHMARAPPPLLDDDKEMVRVELGRAPRTRREPTRMVMHKRESCC